MKIQDYKTATIFATASILADFTAEIGEKVEKHPIYKQIISFLKSDKIKLYFQLCIRSEIEKFVLQYVSKSIANKNTSTKSSDMHGEKSGVWLPSDGIFRLLKECWPQDEVPIESSKTKQVVYFIASSYGYLRTLLRHKLQIIFNFYNKFLCRYDFSSFDRSKPIIGVRYNEGVDFARRSDIVWLKADIIDKSRVLICLDDDKIAFKRKFKFIYYLDSQVAYKLKEVGVQWVSIPKSGLLINVHANGWVPPKKISLPVWLADIKRVKTDEVGRWVLKTAEKLVREVELWKSFYNTFNIRIFFEAGEGSTKYIAQGIAFDMLNKEGGITVGKQRSDIGETPKAMSGFYTKDIFFTWNRRFKGYLNSEFNIAKAQIITGYPNCMNFSILSDEMKSIREFISSKGARFIIALFDTGCGNAVDRIPVHEMYLFYKYFLDWIFEDESLGLIIKSKKPYILKNLPDILEMLKSAEKTGRCVRLENEFGRLPSDASKIADFAVGAGISSSITEAVIGGCKGVRYLKGFPEYHDYFQWGYGKLVFNDLDMMINAIKRYKDNPDSNPELGDWTPYLDLLDPFRDGRASERMGTYIRWCLDGFDVGLNREDVIKQANSKYVATWGNDKVIKFADV